MLSLLASAACSPIQVSRDQREDGEPQVDAMVDEPQEYADRDVNFDGSVQRVFGKCAFEVTDDSTGMFDEPLLVLCAAETPGFTPPDVHEGDHLRLSGHVRDMTRENYEYKTTATVPEDDFGPRETRATLWADRFEVLPKESSGS